MFAYILKYDVLSFLQLFFVKLYKHFLFCWIVVYDLRNPHPICRVFDSFTFFKDMSRNIHELHRSAKTFRSVMSPTYSKSGLKKPISVFHKKAHRDAGFFRELNLKVWFIICTNLILIIVCLLVVYLSNTTNLYNIAFARESFVTYPWILTPIAK